MQEQVISHYSAKFNSKPQVPLLDQEELLLPYEKFDRIARTVGHPSDPGESGNDRPFLIRKQSENYFDYSDEFDTTPKKYRNLEQDCRERLRSRINSSSGLSEVTDYFFVDQTPTKNCQPNPRPIISLGFFQPKDHSPCKLENEAISSNFKIVSTTEEVLENLLNRTNEDSRLNFYHSLANRKKLPKAALKTLKRETSTLILTQLSFSIGMIP